MKNGSTLRSNDNLQIHIKPTKDCYLYALIYDSQGIAGMLFPSRMVNVNNKVRGGRSYHIPGDNNWFYLDNNTGTETIYVLASIAPMEDIDRLLTAMEGAGKRKQQETSQAMLAQVNSMKRGIGGTRTGPVHAYKTSDGDNISNVTQIVEGKGVVVWSINFKHM